MSPETPEPFDLGGPLPEGQVSLEASAGTGKTYAIVGLAVRYLADGHCTAAELLVVTFARSATRELRERLLAGVADSHRLIHGVLAGAAVGTEPLHRALCAGDRTTMEQRRDRLARAMADIDQATVTTIHAFAGMLLRLSGEGAPTGRLLEDDGELLEQIAGDLWLRVLTDHPEHVGQLPNFGYNGLELAQKGVRRAPEDVRPDPSLDSYETAPSWIAVEAGKEYRRRTRRMLVHTHEDVLDRLDHALSEPQTARQLGSRFRIALIDEFQDTDPTQWRIIQSLFPPRPPLGPVGAPEPHRATVVLVGDPKQAIYAFRGADVNAYVDARGEQADFTLPINRRSDKLLVDTVRQLFTDQRLGYGITVPAVEAWSRSARLTGLDSGPVLLRLVPDDAPVRRTDDGGMRTSSLREYVARDVARQAARVLSAGARISTGDQATPRVADRALVPHDIAVLVRTRRQATMVQRHLTTAGVPSIVNGVGNVLQSRAARDWCHLLRALSQPSRSSSARLAALTDLIGWTPHTITTASPAQWDRLHIDLHDWRQVLERDGVAAALRHVESATGMSARLVSQPDGARRLTDLRHVAELLHGVASEELVGVDGLVDWLAAGLAGDGELGTPTPPEHVASRLEQQDGAVQIMTVHGAKGLEFGVVFAPFLWDGVGRNPVAVEVHDPQLGRRILYTGRRRNSPDHQHYHDLHAQQAAEEERRLAYVAATRAKHHLRVWFAPGRAVADSPIGTLLSRGPDRITSTAQATAALADLHGGEALTLDIEVVAGDAAIPTVSLDRPRGSDPVLATVGRPIDAEWRRTSYSRISGQVGEAGKPGPATEADTDAGGLGGPAGATEAVRSLPGQIPPGQPAASDVPTHTGEPRLAEALAETVPLAELRGGADVGTTVHAVLENLDFVDAPVAGRTLERRVGEEVTRQIRRHALELGDESAQDQLETGLLAALRTPLAPPDDPLLGTVSLTDLTRNLRLDEMAFELPVDSRRRPTAGEDAERVVVGDIADLMAATLPGEDPLVSYAGQLRADLAEVPIRGFLAGFVDLVARVPGSECYVLADYKTNKLGPPGAERLTVGDYTGSAMARAMAQHHYPLQSLLYQVALHRYLRWRLPTYRPEHHLGGSGYLFLRGMVGPDTPVADGMRCGVFWWRPPVALITGVDRLFAEGRDA